ncbi:hypothetical protein Hdeb2414_s0125g00804831 [Helianthus debilis subsp. tardiflorus]
MSKFITHDVQAKIFEKYKLGTMIPTLIPSVKELLIKKSTLCHMILQTIKISLRYVGTIFHNHRCTV